MLREGKGKGMLLIRLSVLGRWDCRAEMGKEVLKARMGLGEMCN